MGSRLNYLDAHSRKQRRQIHNPPPSPPPTHTREHTQSVWNSAPFASLLILASPLRFACLKLCFSFLIPSSFDFLPYNNNFLLRPSRCLGSLDLPQYSRFQTLSPSLLISCHLSLTLSSGTSFSCVSLPRCVCDPPPSPFLALGS